MAEAAQHILIIGAGASGLAAGYELLLHGMEVTVLEARNRAGGRIHTDVLPGSQTVVELGAEFVHGLLPNTLYLLQEAGIDTTVAAGNNYKRTIRGLERQDDFIEGWEELVRKASLLERDTSLDNFLDQYFSGAGYADLRHSVRQFTEGYDAADASVASVFSLRKEWENEKEDQFRVAGGYRRLSDHLQRRFLNAGGILHLESEVTLVSWDNGEVTVATTDGHVFPASKLICTVPIGVMQASPGTPGAIRFDPALPQQITEAIGNIGFGPVIKFLFRFREPFWQEQVKDRQGEPLKDPGFFFSRAAIPTWWTQFPSTDPLLTGWLSGPSALALRDEDEDTLLELATESLCSIFSLQRAELQQLLDTATVYNWLRDPYARGAYSFAYPDSERARKVLNRPLYNTIYFAGEGYYRGNASGTVEAALTSGLKVAEIILQGKC